jgi:hypothetical protein
VQCSAKKGSVACAAWGCSRRVHPPPWRKLSLVTVHACVSQRTRVDAGVECSRCVPCKEGELALCVRGGRGQLARWGEVQRWLNHSEAPCSPSVKKRMYESSTSLSGSMQKRSPIATSSCGWSNQYSSSSCAHSNPTRGVSEWSCAATAGGAPTHGRAECRSTQLGVLARPLTRMSPGGKHAFDFIA